jgi:hypothetical protein
MPAEEETSDPPVDELDVKNSNIRMMNEAPARVPRI